MPTVIRKIKLQDTAEYKDLKIGLISYTSTHGTAVKASRGRREFESYLGFHTLIDLKPLKLKKDKMLY